MISTKHAAQILNILTSEKAGYGLSGWDSECDDSETCEENERFVGTIYEDGYAAESRMGATRQEVLSKLVRAALEYVIPDYE